MRLRRAFRRWKEGSNDQLPVKTGKGKGERYDKDAYQTRRPNPNANESSSTEALCSSRKRSGLNFSGSGNLIGSWDIALETGMSQEDVQG